MVSLNVLGASRRLAQEMQAAANAVATGRAVFSAKDNPTYWAIARETSSDRLMVETVNRSLDFAQMKVDTSLVALTSVHESLMRIQAKLVMGLEPGADRAKLGKEIDVLKPGIQSMIESASVNGLNYMVANVPSAAAFFALPAYELSAAYVRHADGTVGLRTIDISAKELNMLSTDTATAGRFAVVSYLNPIAQPAGAAYPTMYYQLIGTASHLWVNARDIALTSTTPTDTIKEMVSALENVRSRVELAMTDLGLASQSVDVHRKINHVVMDEMSDGISNLVDADMTEESARLRALQARSLLAGQMLSLSGRNEEALLLIVA